MIRISELTFDAWGRRFFDNASVALPPGAKVGLVGRNGVGKSTLFKLILGHLHPGGGEITWPKAARISSVDQEHPPPPPRPKPAAAPLKRKLEAAELDLARATEALSLVDGQMADPTLYARNRARFDELSEKRAKAQARLDKAEAEWMAAAEALAEAG